MRLVLVLALHVILDILFMCVRRPCFYLRVCYGAIQIVLLLLLNQALRPGSLCKPTHMRRLW